MFIQNDKININLFNNMIEHFGIKKIEAEATELSLDELFKLLYSNEEINKINLLKQNLLNNSTLFNRTDAAAFQMWPKNSDSLSDVLFESKNKNIIDKNTPIVSMGSCFAIEISKWLQKNNYNYIIEEDNLTDDGVTHYSSAKWGTIFNSPGFYQVIKWAFTAAEPPKVAYSVNGVVRDAFREEITYSTVQEDEIKISWETHLKCSKAALLKAKILILTVGLNEVFEYLPTGDFLHRTPWGLNPIVWQPKILTVEENIGFLRKGLQELRKHNPEVKLIVSVSPVPLLRSIRKDCTVVESTAHSKAVLRVALEEFSKTSENVFYMPSFETVMYPGSKMSPWLPDGRHVTEDIVSKIMSLFQSNYTDSEGELESSWWFPEMTKKSTNQFYELDKSIINKTLNDLIKYGILNIATSKIIINNIKKSLFLNRYDDVAYQTIRKISFLSKFEFNNIAKNYYRQAFNDGNKSEEIQNLVDQIKENGYLILNPSMDSKQFSSELLKAIQYIPTKREIDGKVGNLKALIQEAIPDSFRYFYDETDLPVADIIRCLDNFGVLSLVNGYLGHAILRNVNIWHTISGVDCKTDKGMSSAALEFHRDNDLPLGWIKVFVYLSDVTEANGPHAYVPGSHIGVKKEHSGDQRYNDAFIQNSFNKIEYVCGDSGTIILGDTQCFHKGVEPVSGSRTILQLEFCNSLFGQASPKNMNSSNVLKDLCDFDLRFMSKYLRDSNGF